MGDKYRYVDAVRSLGGTDPVLDALQSAGNAALPIGGVLEARNELVKVGIDLLAGWREWRPGSTWRSRTDRFEAAHAVLVMTAYFEALGTLDLPFAPSGLETLHGDGGHVWDLATPLCPAPHRPFAQAVAAVRGYYRALSGQLLAFVAELDLWARLDEHARQWTAAAYGDELVERAVLRYADRYRTLAQDVPELAYWAGIADHQPSLAGMAELERLISLVASGAALPERLATLDRLHQAALVRPIAETGDLPIGLRLPTLAQAYVTPRFRAAEIAPGDDPSVEEWWEGHELRTDLPVFLSGFLTASAAGEVPLIVLGQPGSGKSVLSKVLAARLRDAPFLPIRVPLREVSATAGIQEQIEQAVHHLSGERQDWPAIARSANGALPVVILDGFDELLQATGVRQSDYLMKVARFQHREADAGRAVAVIVTSRTAVANRAGLPEGTVVARLEPFGTTAMRTWLEVWNAVNADYFSAAGLEPFTFDVALSQRHLARQPLLLLMLAFYDADGNALRRENRTLGQAELYERLMTRYAERALEMRHPREQVARLVERELLRLSFVAASMFNRGRQWATTEEVDADLDVLLPEQRRTPGLATPHSAGHEALARSFFVHRAQAVRDDEVLHTYEFLHATFGEFLIARLLASLMRELVAQESSLALTGVHDGLLRTLLSWATISSRLPVVAFLQELVHDADRWRAVVLRLFRELDAREDSSIAAYRPWIAGPHRRYAYYSANLMVLALSCAPELRASEFMPGHEDVVTEWRSYALLWRSQCALAEWQSLVDLVAVRPVWSQDDVRELHLKLSPQELWDPEPFSWSWAGVDKLLSIAQLRRQVMFSALADEGALLALYMDDLRTHQQAHRRP
ncbi:NACHT domain-containing protein [Nonomuraea glycinis]|uniref:NACHT domain-containing protein n=1 Tax=Nonomuraea glycinis TaxID=2047744 RepID=UPI003F4B09E1